MKLITIASALTVALLFAAPVQAGTSQDLLASATAAGTTIESADLLSFDELAAVQGEGTIEHFFDLPQLRRSFDKHFEFGDVSVWVVAVEGVGITLTIDSPLIP